MKAAGDGEKSDDEILPAILEDKPSTPEFHEFNPEVVEDENDDVQVEIEDADDEEDAIDENI